MTLIFIVVGIVILGITALGVYVTIFSEEGDAAEEGGQNYHYQRKRYFLTRAEHEFYDALGQAVSHEYRIFAQVSLGSILDEKVKGQNWKAARAHINRKSVDFLLCEKDYLAPVLAIELDDKTHEREDRAERDTEVERILKAAGLPLLRVPNRDNFTPQEVASLVRSVLGK